MAQQDGWPLGLRPLNVRVGLVRNSDINGSVSFNTLLTGSPTSSTDSSSDLDTQSTGSFFHDKSITLGSLIGISSILHLSRRSSRGIRTAQTSREYKKKYKPKTWLFSLCSKLSTDAVVSMNNNTPSLRHFLQEERRVAGVCRRNQSPTMYGTDDFSNVLSVSDPNSLFVSGHAAPPDESSAWLGGRRSSSGLFGNESPLPFSCLCGQLTH